MAWPSVAWPSAVKRKGILTNATIMDAPQGHDPVTKGQILRVPTNTSYLEQVPVFEKERAVLGLEGRQGDLRDKWLQSFSFAR